MTTQENPVTQDQAVPRVWHAGDPCPDTLMQVRDAGGAIWSRRADDRWTTPSADGMAVAGWPPLLVSHGPVTLASAIWPLAVDPDEDSEEELDLALLRTLVGPRNDLPFGVWAEQTMRRILTRMEQLGDAIAAQAPAASEQPPCPECGQTMRYDEVGVLVCMEHGTRTAASEDTTTPGWVRVLRARTGLPLTSDSWGHWCCQAGAMAAPGPCPWHPGASGDTIEQATVVLHESGCSGEHCAGLCMENATNLANEGLLASAPLHEWRCPGCGATTRARMADHPAPTKAQESETLVSPDDETVVTVAGALHPAMRSLALFTPEGEAKAAVILARAAISALGGQPNTEESR